MAEIPSEDVQRIAAAYLQRRRGRRQLFGCADQAGPGTRLHGTGAVAPSAAAATAVKSVRERQ